MKQSAKFWLRHPAQAVWLIAVLSLATAVATAAWSISYGVWFQAPPFQDSGHLVSVGSIASDSNQRSSLTSIPEYLDLQTGTRDFLTIASAESLGGAYLREADRAVDVHPVDATTNYFDVLGVSAQRGRLFLAGDAGSSGEVGVISDRLWRSTFGGDPTVIGRIVHIASQTEDRAVTIVGVLPPMAHAALVGEKSDLIIASTDGVRAGRKTSRRSVSRTVIGRLVQGVTREQAEARVTSLLHRIDHDYPLFSRTRTASLVPLQEFLYGNATQFLLLIGAAALLVVVITAANAAGVMLALMSRRSRELAIRAAIGATPRRLAAQMLAESTLIAGVSAMVSILFAKVLAYCFVAWAPQDIPRLSAIAIDWRAYGVAAVLALGFSLLLGVLPAILRRRADVVSALNSGGTSTASTRALLGRRVAIALQVSLVLALLAAAGLVSATLRSLMTQPLGFDPDRVLVAEVRPTQPYFEDRAKYQQVMDQVLAAAATAPGRRSVALALDPPLGIDFNVAVSLADQPAHWAVEKMVSPGFFTVMRIPLLSGRDFTRADYQTGQFVVVNELFATRFFGGVSAAVGKEIVVGSLRHQVVGVVGNVREADLDKPLVPVFYPVMSTALLTPGMFHVVSREGPGPLAPGELERAVQRADATNHVRAYALEDRVREQTAVARTQTAILGLLAVFTLLLAALGIYATIAQVVEDRRRDFGIRSALGATPRSLVVLATTSMLTPVAAGTAGGAALAWTVARLVRQFLFNLSPFDPTIWAMAAAALIITAAIAAWIPARRAGAIDPVIALRQS